MKILKKILFLFLFSIFSILIFAENFKNSENLITGKLENGIHYYIYRNKKPENKAMLNLVVKTGSLMEEDNEQGIAHFMEHMAFNGTTKFEKNEMIKYLQSIGLSFGGDLNAYTSFDRTVYKLLVPTTPKELEDGVEVLREWASEATLNPQEIESEKKVVIEEWRLRQGLTQRLGDVQKKALFEGSRYYDRFPIGLPETINGATQEIVREFYEKWYQPENISVIAVGDFDTNQVESYIHKYFNYSGSRKGESPKEYKLKEGEFDEAKHQWHEENNTYGFSHGLGILIMTIGILTFLGIFSPKIGLIGAGLAIIMTLGTLSFLVTTPEVWVPDLGSGEHGFPLLTGAGRLVIKDVAILAGALVVLSDSARSILKQQNKG